MHFTTLHFVQTYFQLKETDQIFIFHHIGWSNQKSNTHKAEKKPTTKTAQLFF